MKEQLQKYNLDRNPFPPAATGLGGVLKEGEHVFLPKEQADVIETFFSKAQTGKGIKIFPIIGSYGMGKTAVLRGYLKDFFEEKEIKVFYFDNPGVQFYDLANTLMRGLGRYEFSKAIWEVSKQYLNDSENELYLFEMTFEQMLDETYKNKKQNEKARQLGKIIKDKLLFTQEDEIAYKLGQLVIETHRKPYFEYKDFTVSNSQSVVAEKQEDKFFHAIVKAIIDIYGVKGVAFLIDEFEEIAFSKGMSKIKTYEYLSTFRRLVDISESEDLWIAIAMTPEAMEQTLSSNAALGQRFTEAGCKIELNPFSQDDIRKWLIWWLDRYRTDNSSYKGKIFPFPDSFPEFMAKDSKRCTPRKLVKTCFWILSEAINNEILPPFSDEFVRTIVDSSSNRGTQNVD